MPKDRAKRIQHVLVLGGCRGALALALALMVPLDKRKEDSALNLKT